MRRRPDARAATRLVAASLALLASAACKSKEGLSRSSRDVAQSRQIAQAEAAADAATAGPGADTNITRTALPGDPIQVISFVTTDNSIAGPDTVLNGPVEVRFTNRGRFPHELRFVFVPGSASLTSAVRDLKQRPDLAASQALGGAGPLGPGRSMSIVLPIRNGIYVVLCNLPDSAGNPWFKNGVLRILRVTGRSPPVLQPATLPATAAITTSEFSWRFGAAMVRGTNRTLGIEGRTRTTSIPAGPAVIMVDHLGGPGHDLVIIRGDGPLAMDDYTAWRYQGGAAVPDIVGGLPGLFPARGGLRAYIRLDLTPGSYLIFCPTLKRGADVPNFVVVRGYQVGEFGQFVVR